MVINNLALYLTDVFSEFFFTKYFIIIFENYVLLRNR